MGVEAEVNMAEAGAAFLTNPLEAYLTFSEPRRAWVYAIAGVLIAIIAYGDWKLEDVSLGFLYVLPILLAAATLRGWQICALAITCALLREYFSSLHATPGAALRVSVGAAGFALAADPERSVDLHVTRREVAPDVEAGVLALQIVRDLESRRDMDLPALELEVRALEPPLDDGITEEVDRAAALRIPFHPPGS